MSYRALALLAVSLSAVGCIGSADPVDPTVPEPVVAKPPPEPAITKLTPPPGPFNDKVTVRIETDRPATLFVTTDGSDPRSNAKRLTGESPMTIELTKTTTLTFFSRTSEDAEERVANGEYIRAGGKRGTVTGVVVVGTVAVGKKLAVFSDGAQQDLPTPDKAMEVPFTIDGLGSGAHRLRAVADRDDDGNFFPVLDYASEPLNYVLDLEDPFKASLEDVKLYLGASLPKLATIKGTITVPAPVDGQNLSVSALSPDAFSSTADPNALLAQLQNGDRVFTRSTVTAYPYAITDLQPARYIPVPMLSAFGNGGFGMNFIANPFRAVNLAAGDVAEANFSFGPLSISGQVTYKPATAPTGFVYGIVAAKNLSFANGVQGVLMPAVFFPVPATTPAEYRANYAGQGLRSNAQFQLRVFTSGSDPNPIGSAMTWVVTPFGAAPAHATVPPSTADVTLDLTVP